MAPQVRAKFFVTEIKHAHTGSPDGVYATITLAPVYGDSEENKTWSKYTPSGKIEMAITNPPAIDNFEIGISYFVDFTRAR